MGNEKRITARHALILAQLSQRGQLKVEEFATALSVTPQTIRKDLRTLEGKSKVVRFHGGATLLAGIEYTEFENRKNTAGAQKARIAKFCARQIPNNATVVINSGTTTAAVAQALENHSGLRIVTDSVNIANDIRRFPGLEIFVPGGRVRPSDGAVVGHDAVEFIQQFRPDFAVIGVAAIAPDGALLDFDMSEVAVARTIIDNARHVILVADSSKVDSVAPVRIANISQIDTMITDLYCPQILRNLCQNADVRLFEV